MSGSDDMYMSCWNDEIGSIKMFGSYVMCLPFILKFVILLFTFEDIISVLCAMEVSAR
jgi:hypothetical protein